MKGPLHDPFQGWFAFLGGAVAWFFHLMTTYAIGEFACVLDAHQAALWLLIAVTIIALIITVGSIRSAWRCKERFLCQAGLVADAIFLLAIIAQTFPIFTVVGGC